MVNVKVKKTKLIDFSFMPSLKCNLSCIHCMYNASQKNNSVLNINKTKRFISTIDFNIINSIGFYGGEVSCDYENYQKIIDLIPREIIKFTITNGTWSKNNKFRKFKNFAEKNKLQVFISVTKFHKPFQNARLLEKIVKEKDFFEFKEDDEIIPMGRAYKNNWGCSKRCLNYSNPMRLTLNTYGDIMFCNCDGIYPIIGNYDNNFNKVVKNALEIKKLCKKF